MILRKSLKFQIVEIIHALNLMEPKIGIPLNAKYDNARGEIQFDWEEQTEKGRPLLDALKESITILEDHSQVRIIGPQRALILEALNKAFQQLEGNRGIPQAT